MLKKVFTLACVIIAYVSLVVAIKVTIVKPYKSIQYATQDTYIVGDYDYVPKTDVTIDTDAYINLVRNSSSVKSISEYIPVKLTFTKTYADKYGSITYMYSIANTDAVIYVTDGTVSVVQNYYGSNYPILYFEDGVPTGSKDMYEKVLDEVGYTIAKVKCDGKYLYIGGVKIKV